MMKETAEREMFRSRLKSQQTRSNRLVRQLRRRTLRGQELDISVPPSILPRGKRKGGGNINGSKGRTTTFTIIGSSSDGNQQTTNADSGDVPGFGLNFDNGSQDNIFGQPTRSPTLAPTFKATATPVEPEPTRPFRPTSEPTLLIGSPNAAPTVLISSPNAAPTVLISNPSAAPTIQPQSITFEPTSVPQGTPRPTSISVVTPLPTFGTPTANPIAAPLPTVSEIPTQSAAPTLTKNPAQIPTGTTSPNLQLPTSAPTQPVAPTTQKPAGPTGPAFCKSDQNGNFGFLTGPVSDTIQYRYQVETTSQTTVSDLNGNILPQLEKAISDVLVPKLFFQNGECQQQATGRSRASAMDATYLDVKNVGSTKKVKDWLEAGFHLFQSKTPQGESDPNGRKIRTLQSTGTSKDLVGLTVAPADQVLGGTLQNACPFPVGGVGPTNGKPLLCYVVGGGVSVYGFGNLSWVNPIVQTTLDETMKAGRFDNGTVNKDVIYVRYISPDTILNGTGNGGNNTGSGIREPRSKGGTPSWAWVLIALGIFGLLLCLIYLFMKRKQHQESHEEFERRQRHADQYVSQDEGREDDEDDGSEPQQGRATTMDEEAELLRRQKL